MKTVNAASYLPTRLAAVDEHTDLFWQLAKCWEELTEVIQLDPAFEIYDYCRELAKCRNFLGYVLGESEEAPIALLSLRSLLCLILGEVLGTLYKANAEAREKDASQLIPRAFKVSANFNSDRVGGRCTSQSLRLLILVDISFRRWSLLTICAIQLACCVGRCGQLKLMKTSVLY